MSSYPFTTITVYNTGTQPTGRLTISSIGVRYDHDTSLDSIPSGGSRTFEIRPNSASPVGTHNSTITVSGNNGITASFDVSFTVYDGRRITINAFDHGGDGWNNNGWLRIEVDGALSFTHWATAVDSYTTTYFDAAYGSVIKVYWQIDSIIGSKRDENSFIIFYTDTPPSPAFNATSNATWAGSNSLLHRLRGYLYNANDGDLLGQFTVTAP
jgi:hypothetical protein